MRLDAFLAERGLADSRARARDAILRGHVRVNGSPASKPGQTVAANAAVEIDDPAAGFVSRGALKLAGALDAFGIDPKGSSALDIGVSTGGFTDLLLQRGASHVIAVDVGHDQLHFKLRDDPRITLHEGLNARDLNRSHLAGHAIDLVVSDVSFISLKLALPPALMLATGGARAVLLVKPQFEAGREAIGKGGLLRDPDLAPQIAERLRDWLDTLPGWRAQGLLPSPVAGGDGNREFLLVGLKS